MSHLRKTLFTLMLFAMVGTSTLHAQNCYSTSTGGCGYMECRRAPCITPAVALGTIALVAIIAVAVQNSSGRAGHAHNAAI
jgi:hypothetical protein